jgi:hypothetical protein
VIIRKMINTWTTVKLVWALKLDNNIINLFICIRNFVRKFTVHAIFWEYCVIFNVILNSCNWDKCAYYFYKLTCDSEINK